MKKRISHKSLDDISTNSIQFNSFMEINEKKVEEISLNFLYKPHTLTLLYGAVSVLMYFAFVR
jgi:hypothetical protein